MPKARIEEERMDCGLHDAPSRRWQGEKARPDSFLKSTRIWGEQKDSGWQREGAELAQTLTMGE